MMTMGVNRQQHPFYSMTGFWVEGDSTTYCRPQVMTDTQLLMTEAQSWYK